VDGALALSPETGDRLNAQTTSDSVARMAWPEAPGLAARAALREEERATARRARRIAALVGVTTVALVVLLLTAFGSNGPLVGDNVPAPAQRLLPSGPPRPQIVATHESLRIQLPINQARVTAIGYHASGAPALALEPIGSQANAGLFGRIVQRLVGDDGSGISYYLLEGGTGPRTGGLDVGAPVGTDVYAPVDGSVIALSDRVVNGKPYGKVIEIQPSDNPGVVVALSNLAMDPALTVGRTLVAARTKIGRVIDLSTVEHAALARYTQDKGQHVHVELHAAASLAAP
jgi:murein DD-endopeptidase MepM/ murein hydrolase activator NlpD